MMRFLTISAATLLVSWTSSLILAVAGEEVPPEEWVFLDNGEVKLGVLRDRGAGIAWFSASGSDTNLVNHWDHGRLIQQSFYGKADGSLWNDKPWRWNPVQGGDWKGSPAKLLEFTSTQTTLYARTRGRHWAACRDLDEVVFEQWIELDGPLAKVKFRFTYSGKDEHPAHHHEIPAVFVAPELDTLVIADADGRLVRSKPGWPNESRAIPKKWAAYIDPRTERGIGVYVEAAETMTCYRFGDGKPEHGSCSYFAPLVRFAVTPGKVFEYEAVLAAGEIGEISKHFSSPENKPAEMRIWPGVAPDEPVGITEKRSPTTDDGKTVRIAYVDTPTLTLYRPEKPNGTGVIVLPGGGYNILAWNKEGTEIAEWLNTLGITAAVLKYRVPRRDAKEPHPWPLQDARRAMRLARFHAEDWGIDPDKLGVLGFSAGGNLAVMLASHWASEDYPIGDAADNLSARPNFVIPIYPAYLGDPKDKAELSPLVKIDRQTAPMFIAITHDDSDRAAYAALLYVELKRAQVPAELHIYSRGGHGYGMRPSDDPVSTWPQRCEDWLRASTLIPSAGQK